MASPLLSRRTVLGGGLAVLTAGCQARPEGSDRADASCGNASRRPDNAADNQVGEHMERVIGYWSWDGDARTMHRIDGAAVRFLGIDRTRPASATTLWMNFEIVTACGRLQLPAQQRLVDRDENYRALWYKVDFRDTVLSADLWAAAERLIADALASWPRGDLVDAHPTGVGIAGGFSGGAFLPNMYRLYLPSYAGKPLFEGAVAPNTGGQRWTMSSPSAGPTVAGQELVSLASGPTRITLRAGEHRDLRLEYRDETFGSDRFVCTLPSAGQDWLWSIIESGGSKEFLENRPENFFDLLFGSRRRERGSRKRPERLPPAEQERAYAAFHDAFFALSPTAIQTNRLASPPTVVKSWAPWRRAGYLMQRCLTAKALRGQELQAAFADEPDVETMFASPAGPAFDAANGIIHAPDGSSLAVEQVDEQLGMIPTRLTLRCRSSGLDWPIVIRRIDRRPKLIEWAYQPQLMSRWQIDHDECLEAWRREGYAGLPDPDAWDTMRQFVEEAILSWGDGIKGGPAPQSLATSGGWYDGQWRGNEFRRLLARPINTSRFAKTDAWRPYLPATPWRRSDSTPADRPDTPRHNQSGPIEPPVWFAKMTVGKPPAHLSASGYIIRHSREEQYAQHLVDYHGSGDHVRMGGTRSHLATAGILRIDNDKIAAGQLEKFPWPPPSAIEQPSLQLWRHLRDAAESGLRSGEAVTVTGGYFFDRFYGDSLRVTALSAEIDDFDYRMFGRGNDFQ